ncbi:hypothetical protein D3C84_459650 [compost metagenome]
MRAQLFQVAAGTEQEHAAVPEVFAGADKFGGGLLVGFFDKLLDLEGMGARIAAVGLDVAEAGFRTCRRNAEQHQIAFERLLLCVFQCGAQSGDVADHMVGRKDQHELIAAFGNQLEGCQRHRRCGVAAEGFEQDRLRRAADGGKLFVDEKAMLLITHHDRFADTVERQALQGLLKE